MGDRPTQVSLRGSERAVLFWRSSSAAHIRSRRHCRPEEDVACMCPMSYTQKYTPLRLSAPWPGLPCPALPCGQGMRQWQCHIDFDTTSGSHAAVIFQQGNPGGKASRRVGVVAWRVNHGGALRARNNIPGKQLGNRSFSRYGRERGVKTGYFYNMAREVRTTPDALPARKVWSGAR